MQPLTLRSLRNSLHSVVLVLGMAGIAATCAWTLWGVAGIVWAGVAVSLAMVLSPRIPPGLVLGLYQARPLSRSEFPDGYAVLHELARRAELPAAPRLHYIPSGLINAFAVGGRRAAAIAVTDGMLRTLTLRELAGVLAHEVSHIANNDLWIMTLADVMSRATSLLSYFGIALLLLNVPLLLMGAVTVPWLLVLLLVFAPTLMSLLQLALSRAREYDADLDAVRLSGDPDGLASALAKMERYQGRFWEEILFPGRRIPEPSLLRTHPETAERIRRLADLAAAKPAGPVTARSAPVRTRIPIRVVRAPPRWRRWGYWY